MSEVRKFEKIIDSRGHKKNTGGNSSRRCNVKANNFFILQVEAFFIKSHKKKVNIWTQDKLNHQLELIAKTKKIIDNKVYENR